jgi:hypothetical protein
VAVVAVCNHTVRVSRPAQFAECYCGWKMDGLNSMDSGKDAGHLHLASAGHEPMLFLMPPVDDQKDWPLGNIEAHIYEPERVAQLRDLIVRYEPKRIAQLRGRPVR